MVHTCFLFSYLPDTFVFMFVLFPFVSEALRDSLAYTASYSRLQHFLGVCIVFCGAYVTLFYALLQVMRNGVIDTRTIWSACMCRQIFCLCALCSDITILFCVFRGCYSDVIVLFFLFICLLWNFLAHEFYIKICQIWCLLRIIANIAVCLVTRILWKHRAL